VVLLARGDAVVVFDVLDDCTRLLVACHAAASETTAAAIAAFAKACAEHGPPALVLTDNGAAFTHRRLHPAGPPSAFTRAVTATGAQLIHSSPYHPQTCGKVERHHQTLKQWLAAQPRQPATLTQLQRLLDRYRDHYNTRRHSALGRQTPQHAWTTAPSHGGPQHPPAQTDATVAKRRVTPTGVINLAGARIGVGAAWHGHTLTAIRDHHRITVYTPDGRPLGHATLNPDASYTPLTPHDPQ
jgi:hypothetical protein